MTSDRDPGDARMRELMQAAAPQPPIEQVDWTVLHTRVMARVRNVQRPAAWWQLLAAWSAKAIPAAAAAAAAAMIALTSVLRPGVTDAASFVVIEEELAAGLAGSLPLLVAGADEDVLDALLLNEGED